MTERNRSLLGVEAIALCRAYGMGWVPSRSPLRELEISACGTSLPILPHDDHFNV